MRLNKFIAASSPLSRRHAEEAICAGRVQVNGQQAAVTTAVNPSDIVTLDGEQLYIPEETVTILLNKPTGYVVSRDGQGSRTIYDLLPPDLHRLNPVGRLDKDTSGLLLLTSDGALAEQLTHPRNHKVKIYEIQLDKPLAPLHQQIINDTGIQLEDGRSQLSLEKMTDDATTWRVTMHEGRNRQIRRTFAALGYAVTALHRTHFGPYRLSESLPAGQWSNISAPANSGTIEV